MLGKAPNIDTFTVPAKEMPLSIGDTIYTTTATFAKFINGIPKFFFYRFDTVCLEIDTIIMDTYLKIDSSIYNPEETFFYPFGITKFTSAFENYTRVNGIWDIFMRTENIPDLVDSLITQESRYSVGVGVPASIIRLTKNGIEWIQKGVCE